MESVLLGLCIYLAIFLSMWLCEMLGNVFGLKQKEAGAKTLGIVKVAEGTVFALLGLLVAFSFSGAYDRFEARKMRIVDEVNAVNTAYRRIDLLSPETQQPLRASFKHYLDSRIAMYDQLSDRVDSEKALERFSKMQQSIWHQTLEATRKTNNYATSVLFIDSIDKMFDIAGERLAIIKLHPPIAIFTLLIGIAMLSAFLVGYTTAGKKFSSRIFTLGYIAITSFTLYIILDLEFPRLGMMRINTFDRLLIDERRDLN